MHALPVIAHMPSSLVRPYRSHLHQDHFLTFDTESQRFQATACELPQRNKSNTLIQLSWIMFAISTLFFLGRMVARLLVRTGLHKDDWTIMSSYLPLVGAAICIHIAATANGFGQDSYNLTIYQISGFLKVCTMISDTFPIASADLSGLLRLHAPRTLHPPRYQDHSDVHIPPDPPSRKSQPRLHLSLLDVHWPSPYDIPRHRTRHHLPMRTDRIHLDLHLRAIWKVFGHQYTLPRHYCSECRV